MKRLLIIFILAFTLVGAQPTRAKAPINSYDEIQTEVAATAAKPDRLDRYLDMLSVQCECPKCRRLPLTKILDTNNKYSYGPWMWQKSTFIEGVKKYNLLPYAETEEYMNFIYDYDFGKHMARRMIEDGESWRWANCVAKLGPIPH
jgi:hypothetical protein